MRKPIILWCLLIAALSGQAQAQTVKEFYQGRHVTLTVGFNAGGAYDLYARAVSRHIGKHIPGSPNIVVENLPGAGSVIAANRLYTRAAKDGSEIGLIGGSTALDPLFGIIPTQFKGQEFTWLGSVSNSTGVCFAWHASPVKTAADLFEKQLITGTAGTDTLTVPSALNRLLGAKMKLVSGYNGTAGLMLAMERGEIEGMCGMVYDAVKSARTNWLKDNLVRVVIQVGLNRSPQLPDVPSVMDFAKSDEDRQLLRLLFGWTIMGPFLAPPGIPQDRAEALRSAFNATMVDQEFLAETKKQNLDINPITGSDIEKFLKDAYETPKPTIERAARIFDLTSIEKNWSLDSKLAYPWKDNK